MDFMHGAFQKGMTLFGLNRGGTTESAELQPPTTPEFPVEELGLGLSLVGTTLSDSIASADQRADAHHSQSFQIAPLGVSDALPRVAVETMEESGSIDEEAALRNATERDLSKLTVEQAEIETARGISESVADDEEGKGAGTMDKDSRDGKDEEIFEVENDTDEGKPGGKFRDSATKLGRNIQSKNRRRIKNLTRPDAEDCASYTKFGSHCQFKHPPRKKNQDVKRGANHKEKSSERAGQTECKDVKKGANHKEKSSERAEQDVKKGANHKEKSSERAGQTECKDVKKGANHKEKSSERAEQDVKRGANHKEKSSERAGQTECKDAKKGANHKEKSSERAEQDVKEGANHKEKSSERAEQDVKKGANHKEKALERTEQDVKDGANHKEKSSERGGQDVKKGANHKEKSSERGGQTECKFYRTSGGCKHGKDCKYSHWSDKSSTSHSLKFNFMGLPLRPGKKECPYYMRTGSCKHGSDCWFHHPEPTAVVAADSSGYDNGGTLPLEFVSSSSFSPQSSPRAFNETSSFVPVMCSPTKDIPTSSPEWNGYQAATYPTSQGILPTPPALTLNRPSTEIHFPMQPKNDTVLEEYPEHPGEPECRTVLKNGDCKFKSNKCHRPKNHMSKAKANSHSLNDKGLPLRPDQPVCTQYHRLGICKYGPACKYNHPSQLAISRTSSDQPNVT